MKKIGYITEKYQENKKLFYSTINLLRRKDKYKKKETI